MNKLFEAFGGRRYFMAFMVWIAANVWLGTGHLKDDNFVTLMSWVLGIYVGGNVLQKFVEAKNDKK